MESTGSEKRLADAAHTYCGKQHVLKLSKSQNKRLRRWHVTVFHSPLRGIRMVQFVALAHPTGHCGPHRVCCTLATEIQLQYSEAG